MFFEFNVGFIWVAHEWLCWAFILGVVAHIMINLPAFKKHLRTKVGIWMIGIFGVILAASIISPSGGLKRMPPERRAVENVANADLGTVAILAKTTPDALIEKLKKNGVAVENAQQTLRQLSGGSREEERELFGIVFAAE